MENSEWNLPWARKLSIDDIKLIRLESGEGKKKAANQLLNEKKDWQHKNYQLNRARDYRKKISCLSNIPARR